MAGLTLLAWGIADKFGSDVAMIVVGAVLIIYVVFVIDTDTPVRR